MVEQNNYQTEIDIILLFKGWYSDEFSNSFDAINAYYKERYDEEEDIDKDFIYNNFFPKILTFILDNNLVPNVTVVELLFRRNSLIDRTDYDNARAIINLVDKKLRNFVSKEYIDMLDRVNDYRII